MQGNKITKKGDRIYPLFYTRNYGCIVAVPVA